MVLKVLCPSKHSKTKKPVPIFLSCIRFYHLQVTINNFCSAKSVSLIKKDELDVTSFIISLFTAQHVSNVSTSIFRILQIIVDLFHVLYCSGSMCVGVTPQGWAPGG